MSRKIAVFLFMAGLFATVSAQAVTVSGTITYSGAVSGTVFVIATTNLEDATLEYEWSEDVTGPFTNSYELTGLNPDTYYIFAEVETNDVSSLELPWGHYQIWSNAPTPIDTDPGDIITNMDFELVDGSVSNNPYAVDDGNDPGSGPRVFDGSVYDGLGPSQGWVWDEGRRVSEEYFFDSSIVRLTNGNYRLYGNCPEMVTNQVFAFDSYISSNGVDFTKESGYRFEEQGCFMPWVIWLSNNVYRCYYTDQHQHPNGGEGGLAIKSAISTNDGLDFVTEGVCLACDTNLFNEFGGVRAGRPLKLNGGTWRMYYHADGADGIQRVLSAISSDGLSWTRESGVRLDPADYSPYSEGIHNFAPSIPFGGDIVHLYTTMMRTDNGTSKAGIFDSTSSDGLTFTVADDPILLNYYIAGSYTGDPSDPQVMAQDPTVILTATGMRMYFGVYDGPNVLMNTSGIYSVILPDWDGDNSDDWEEYAAGTDPNDSSSCFQIETVDGSIIRWSSVAGKTYCIDRSTNLLTGFDTVVATNLLAVPPSNVYTDETASGSASFFYRIRLE